MTDEPEPWDEILASGLPEIAIWNGTFTRAGDDRWLISIDRVGHADPPSKGTRIAVRKRSGETAEVRVVELVQTTPETWVCSFTERRQRG